MTSKPCPQILPLCPVCKGSAKRYTPGARWRYETPTAITICPHCNEPWCAFHRQHRADCACLLPGQQPDPAEPCGRCGGTGRWSE